MQLPPGIHTPKLWGIKEEERGPPSDTCAAITDNLITAHKRPERVITLIPQVIFPQISRTTIDIKGFRKSMHLTRCSWVALRAHFPHYSWSLQTRSNPGPLLTSTIWEGWKSHLPLNRIQVWGQLRADLVWLESSYFPHPKLAISQYINPLKNALRIGAN